MTPHAANLREALARLSALGWAALSAVLLAGLLCLLSLGSVVLVLAGPAPDAAGAPADAAETTKYASNVDNWSGVFNRRSVFFVPSPPEREDPLPPPVTVDRPSAPTVYGGPSLIAMMNDTAFFQDGRRLRVGADADGDLRVVRIDPPWTATVEWKKVEFSIPLFGRDSTVVRPAGTPASVPLQELPPPPPQPKPAAPKPEEPSPQPVPAPAVPPSEGPAPQPEPEEPPHSPPPAPAPDDNPPAPPPDPSPEPGPPPTQNEG